jgi:KDO2-lipid IV(A) lauroyltransferase
VPVFGEELPGGRYRVEALPPVVPLAGEDDVALTRRYLATLEMRVRERPELWLWLHRRWKR